jgi:hypothetical protein
MPKYVAYMRDTVTNFYEVTVYAESEDQALEKVYRAEIDSVTREWRGPVEHVKHIREETEYAADDIEESN